MKECTVADHPSSPNNPNRSENARGLTAEEVIDAVRRRGGKPPSQRQFRRFEQLLPRAPSISSGKRGRPPTRYSLDAVEWVEAIREIRGPRWRKLRLDVLAFELWWRDFAVDPEKVRAYLVVELRRRLGGLGGRRKASSDPSQVADALVKELRKSPQSRHPVLRLLLRRVGGRLDAVADGLYALILFFLGEESDWETGDVEGAPDAVPPVGEVLTALFAFDRAATDAAPDGTRLLEEPINLRELLSELRELSGGDVRRLWFPMETASPAELERARADARPYAQAMQVMVRGLERLFGWDFAGFGIVTAVYRTDERYLRIVTLLAMLTLRPRYAEGIEKVNEALTANESRFRAYVTVTDAFPQYRKYLRFNREEVVATLPDEFRTKMEEDVQTFLDDNPEVQEELVGK